MNPFPRVNRSAEWPATLDVGALIDAGWRPRPFRQFVLKLHSRCDLDCDYCYIYALGDQRWRERPRVISPRTLDLVADRIAEHAVAHRLPAVTVVLHGGEPLLAGPAVLTHAVTRIRAALAATATATGTTTATETETETATEVRFTVQTNGVRLTREVLRVLDGLGVRVGVSMDGDRAAHDRNRRRPNGAGSHAQVARAVRRLSRPPFRQLFGGLLCTIDLRNDPVRVYEALLEYEPPVIDFLLPEGNWSKPPPGRRPDSPDTPYADWLIAVFDRWYEAPVAETRIRLFAEIIHLLLGGRTPVEGVGLAPADVVVIETDGAIEQSDLLGVAYPGAAATGLHVADDPLDAALRLPGVAARQLGADALAPKCRECRWLRTCGGGLYSHRYRAGGGFRNPSVYCPDLSRLIGHVRRRLERSVARLREPAR